MGERGRFAARVQVSGKGGNKAMLTLVRFISAWLLHIAFGLLSIVSIVMEMCGGFVDWIRYRPRWKEK